LYCSKSVADDELMIPNCLAFKPFRDYYQMKTL
jgi:hypothetical protein